MTRHVVSVCAAGVFLCLSMYICVHVGGSVCWCLAAYTYAFTWIHVYMHVVCVLAYFHHARI